MILAPIRLKFELVVNIIMEVGIFVNTNFKKIQKKNSKKFKRVVFLYNLWYSYYCRGDTRGKT